MNVPDRIKKLTETFSYNLEAYKKGLYNETQVRREFIDPFFEELGWDITNKQGYTEAYKEVIHEDAIKVGGITKAPDYCFRIGGARKFFLEAKKPSVNIKEDVHPAYQLRRYGWSAKLPLSILTDFEEFSVYDCRVRPTKTDKASHSRILYLKYTDYAERWREIADIFSREAIPKGSFDKYVQSKKVKKGTTEVDTAFLQEIERWRDLLARNIALRNKDLSQRELNFAIQQTIDRIIFLRICEDRGIENYGRLMALQNGEKVYKRLFQIFHKADDKYNSGLFHFKKEKGRDEFKFRAEDLKLNFSAASDKMPRSLIINRGSVIYEGERIQINGLTGKAGASEFSDITGNLLIDEQPMVRLKAAALHLNLKETYHWLTGFEGLKKKLKPLKGITGNLVLSKVDLNGPFLEPENLHFNASGQVKAILLDLDFLPGPIGAASGVFNLNQDKLVFNDMEMSMLDSRMRVSGKLEFETSLKTVWLTGKGHLKSRMLSWIKEQLNVPKRLVFKSPFLVSSANFFWDKDDIFFQADLTTDKWEKFNIDLARRKSGPKFWRVYAKDEKSEACIGIEENASRVSFNFDGQLQAETLNRLLKSDKLALEALKGNLWFSFQKGMPWDLSGVGYLEGRGVGFRLAEKVPIQIARFSLDIVENKLTLNHFRIDSGESRMFVDGTVWLSPDTILMDVDVLADFLDLNLLKSFKTGEQKGADTATPQRNRKPEIYGNIRLRADTVKFNRFLWQPLAAEAQLVPGKATVLVKEAMLCGISMPGTLIFLPQRIEVRFDFGIQDQSVDHISRCLSKESIRVKGILNAKVEIIGAGPHQNLAENLTGSIRFSIRDGQIHKSIHIANILKYLRISKLIRGKFAGLNTNDLVFNAIVFKGFLENGHIRIESIAYDGGLLDIAAKGTVDVSNGMLDLDVVVVPMKTANVIVRHIPLLGYVLGGTAVGIPVKITGDLKNSKIIPLNPGLVGSRLLNILRRTAKIPLEMLNIK